ncbi:MAG: hypothetical protein FRX49_12250, partial [Trebouxia sp. A1-2]
AAFATMDAKVVQAAEQQMRRSAPENPLSKRHKTGTESYQSVARYNYSSQESLQQGAQGFIVTCAFRREKSATKEAVALISQYLVAYKSRGSSNKPTQGGTVATDSPQEPGPANRQQVISLVAATVEEAVVSAGGKVHVDLKHPQVVILVEVLPISAASLCAISWVPASVTVQTPKLMIKPLVSLRPPTATHTERRQGLLQMHTSGLVGG